MQPGAFFSAGLLMILSCLSPAKAQQVTFSILDSNTIAPVVFDWPTAIASSAAYHCQISRFPDSANRATYSKYRYLITAIPDENNYDQYYDLGLALFQLNMNDSAEKIFLTILNSEQPFYTSTYYHSSDIPGDTNTNIYGYGSFRSHYKNYACRYLAKICIERKKFSKAMNYVSLAENKYKNSYSCGTGFQWYSSEIGGLKIMCYEGLGEYKLVLEHLLPEYYTTNYSILCRVIKKVYSKEEIQKYLEEAIQSFRFTPDTSASRVEYWTSDDSTHQFRTYWSGEATMQLFGKTIELPKPYLEEGEILTAEWMLRNFKKSSFYWELNRNLD